ncbi:MAG: bifunctional 4-hydroxy-2-oxoglutarate aldolase/2-dehydro-3-deoxy-phosphogluconate aldolase [Fibrobacter sp.]|jgi:2-dehydro-3-deoxyphosphogluconate aldolase/(4S)-4-hydroxy-2-oxoglutarate aldolase|nr:bifunctional 4-hydroxy-2-oxoglutarate aldolase/2-dehydro-3-deoxy-phosphogluconate aldolase [Fibrobacter sp.]
MLNKLSKAPVIGILRDIPQGQELSCIQSAFNGGLKAIEVTMNTPGAVSILKELKKYAAEREILVGAGTVRTLQDLDSALNAGAEFIVSPSTIPEVIREGVRAHIPMIPGALTPTEVQTAFDLGATCVKIFPVRALGGADYIKELRGPFRDIKLLACGGVHRENARAFLNAGTDLLAIGGSIFKPELMHAGMWNEIEDKLKDFMSAL